MFWERVGDGEEAGAFFEVMLLPTSHQLAAIYRHRVLYTCSRWVSVEALGVMAGSVHTVCVSNQKNANMARGPAGGIDTR